MAQANFYFNKFQHAGEQNLIADLVTESISIYGMDVGYLAKTIVEYDELLTEVDLAQFNQVSDVVMYVKSADGFEGEGDFLSKFGVEQRDTMTMSNGFSTTMCWAMIMMQQNANTLRTTILQHNSVGNGPPPTRVV